MKHPDPEEWVAYLYSETDLNSNRLLAEHLRTCGQCSAQLAGWRRSLRRLNTWKVPKRRRPSINFSIARPLRWAAAAALFLAAGFIFGRSSTPSLESVRQELQAESGRQLHALREEVVQAQASGVRASAARTGEALKRLAEVLRAERAEEQRSVWALLETLDQEHRADFIALRKDLETLATQTDREIREAHLTLGYLSAYSTDNSTHK